jgi:hypothetical protein
MGDCVWADIFPPAFFKRVHVNTALGEKTIDDIVEPEVVQEYNNTDWDFMISKCTIVKRR